MRLKGAIMEKRERQTAVGEGDETEAVEVGVVVVRMEVVRAEMGVLVPEDLLLLVLERAGAARAGAAGAAGGAPAGGAAMGGRGGGQRAAGGCWASKGQRRGRPVEEAGG